jgi:hypothetical protein
MQHHGADAPMPFISGCSTPMAKAVVTAASTALPPFCSTSTPMRAPSGCWAVTMPSRAVSSSCASTGRLSFIGSSWAKSDRKGGED